MERRYQLIVLVVALLVFGGSAISPPGLMDDVDAVQAQIARNMLDSGDWVTARLDGIAYLEKAPMPYWMMACSYAVFGVHDWAARVPFVLSAIVLCWLVARMAAWAFSERAGLYAGLSLATSIGLWLFTRIQIPDVTLTLMIALALWAFVRKWPYLFWAAMGVGFLLKGLVAMVFPLAAVVVYWTVARRWSEWRSLRPFTGPLVTLAIGAPWVVLAALRNPPYFDFTMRSVPGEYHGFFWFFFLNEHLFRFLNMRYPRDYNTVPRAAFWLFHLLWFFPWSVYLPAAFKATATEDRARQMRLLCLCWLGFILVFFTFSTTQEYYSMPAYPAFAILLGAGLDSEHRWLRPGSRVLGVLCGAVAALLFVIFWMVRGVPTPGDIAQALTSNPDVYTLSLGHMTDLTLQAFAYLRGPVMLAAVAFAIGAYSCFKHSGQKVALALAVMMVLFTQAARWALVGFDPYLGSRPLAEALKQSPPGDVIFDNQYYAFSSVFFYANTKGWLLNGRVNNLEYGSYAPGAPQIFLDDEGFAKKWLGEQRCYLLIEWPSVPRLQKRVGVQRLHAVKSAGGKFLYTNLPLENRPADTMKN
ncbi:MAG: glycosyltransferase family 39 protein [Bryobacteraceae bacterium]